MASTPAAAELPRVLDVRNFAKARETELRYLLLTARQAVGDSRFGAPSLPRHLRRRATSHRRFIVRRRPNLRLAGLHGEVHECGGDIARYAVSPCAIANRGTGRNVRRRGCAGQPLPAPEPEAESAAVGPGCEPHARGAAQVAPLFRPTNRAMRRRPTHVQAATEASFATDLIPQLPRPSPSAERSSQQQPGQMAGTDGTVAHAVDSGQAWMDDFSTVADRPGVEGEELDRGMADRASSARRLETHVWHARRIAMETRWGHVLPSHAVGRRRGSRSLLATARCGTLLHDASYQGCVDLRGHQRQLAELLRRVSDPSLLDQLLQCSEVISGAAEWGLNVHRPAAFPQGLLAPVRGLWLTEPESGAEVCAIDADGWASRCVLWLWVHAAAFTDVWDALNAAALGAASCPKGPTRLGGAGGTSGSSQTGSAVRPTAAASPKLDAAAAAGHEGGVGMKRLDVCISSRCSDLRRIEVVGCGADAALAAVLMPLVPQQPTAAETSGAGTGGVSTTGAAVTCASDTIGNVSCMALGSRIWRTVTAGGGGGDGTARWGWPNGAVLGMEVADPRLATPVRVGAVCADGLAAAADLHREQLTRAGGEASDKGVWSGGERPQRGTLLSAAELRRQLCGWPEAGDWAGGAAALWRSCPDLTAASAHHGSISINLMDALPSSATASLGSTSAAVRSRSLRIPPPLSAAQMSAARRHARQRLLTAGLAAFSAPVNANTGNTCGGSGSRDARSQSPHALSFPVLLVRRLHGSGAASGRGSATGNASTALAGWSLVLPARWVMPVWLSLAFTGARPTGQLEWRQLATHCMAPCFPYDFPFTPAGEQYNRERLSEMEAAASRRPLGRARLLDWGPLADWSRLMTLIDKTAVRQAPNALRGKPGGCRTPPGKKQAVSSAPAPNTDTQQPANPSLGTNDAPSRTPERASVDACEAAGERSPAAQRVLAQRAEVMWKLLGADRGTVQPPTQQGGPRAALVDKQCLHGWTLRKAIKLGLVVPPPPLPRGGTVAAGAEGGCLVYLALRVRGRGVCKAGAEVLGLCGNGRLDEVNAGVGHTTAAMASTMQPQPSPGYCEVVLLGYVVSAVPRGSPAYPGGIAVCDARGLLRLAASTSEQRVGGQTPAPAALERLLFGGSGSAGIRVWLRNGGSAALRECGGAGLVTADGHNIGTGVAWS